MAKGHSRKPASRQPTAQALENQAIRDAVVKAVALERAKGPFLLSGRGHEPRVTLDMSLAQTLRGIKIPLVHISGYGANYHYPARVFDSARRILRRRFRRSPISQYEKTVYRARKPSASREAPKTPPPNVKKSLDQLQDDLAATTEMTFFSNEELDRCLFRSAKWVHGFTARPPVADTAKVFSRISKRRKLLTLILLTDSANLRFPDIVHRFDQDAGTSARNSLNWIILDRQRVAKLLADERINRQARVAIEAAIAAGLCDDDASKILDDDQCKRASIAIMQHGSLKHRIGMVRAMNADDAQLLVSGSDPDLVIRCIEWAKSLD